MGGGLRLRNGVPPEEPDPLPRFDFAATLGVFFFCLGRTQKPMFSWGIRKPMLFLGGPETYVFLGGPESYVFLGGPET